VTVLLGRWMVVIALVLSTGAHWAVLQVSAWTGMVISYSQEVTVSEAIEMTFDGEHPCKMCKLVKAGRKAEQEKSTTLKVEMKFDLIFDAKSMTVYAPVVLQDGFRIFPDRPSRQDPPLLRPPIFA